MDQRIIDNQYLDGVVHTLADAIAQRVVDQLLTGEVGYVDQVSSPLGRRNHINAIRRGVLPGKQIGRRWLARIQDVEGYISRSGTAEALRRQPADDSVDQLATTLGFTAESREKRSSGSK